MADTTVKFFHSAMTGAPQITGALTSGAGTLIPVLKAALVDGWGSNAVDSVVVASGIATVTRSAGHPFEKDTVALMSGATPSGLNGEKKIITTTTTTYTFDATGISDQTATGTISHKLSPAGWTQAFSGTGLAAFKSADVTSTGCYLRVDDTATTVARVVGYETMSDINTGTGPFPTSAQQSGGGYWPKSSAADSTTRAWTLIADGKMFYLIVQYSNTQSCALDCVFGDTINMKSPDAYGCVLAFAEASPVGTTAGSRNNDYDFSDLSSSAGLYVYMPRSYTGVGSAAALRKGFQQFTLINSINSLRSGDSTNTSLIPYPNPSDGGLYAVPHYLVENNNKCVRAQSPGFYCTPQQVSSSVFGNRDSITGVVGLSGRTLKAFNSLSGMFMFDVTGPWR